MEDVLSLEEMLAEGATDTFKNRYNVREKYHTSEQTVRPRHGVVLVYQYGPSVLCDTWFS